MVSRLLKATERSLRLLATRVAVRTGAALAPERTARFVARQFFRTVRPEPQRFAITAPTIGQLAVPDGEVTTYSWGVTERDPTILLIHGWNGWSQQMERFVAPLQARGFAVMAFDHVAHGASRGDRASLPIIIRTVEHVLKELPQPAGIVAHSIGAAATAAVLASGGHTLRGAVLIAPPSDPRPYLTRLALLMGAPARLLASIQHAAERMAGTKFERLVARPSQTQHIRTPLMIVHDVDDNEVPISNGYAYSSAPQVRVLATDGLGHRRILRDLHVVDSAAAFIACSQPPRRSDSLPVRAPEAEGTPYGVRHAALLPAA